MKGRTVEYMEGTMKIRSKIILSLILAAVMLLLYALPGGVQERGYRLPVLMYHHFDETVAADTVVSPERFREQMTALKNAGYTTVTLQQILDFVDHGVPLPQKAVLITMDDGYTSNLTVAAPILAELEMCATVFLIGIYEGEEISPNSGNSLYPTRFSYENAMQWVEKGVLDLQSHTYNMHQRAHDGFSGRDGILLLEGEKKTNYQTALMEDVTLFAEKRTAHGVDTPLLALAYPYGFYGDESEDALRDAGICFTFTVEERNNLLQIGQRDCLWNMGRFNVTERDSGEKLVRRLGTA